ncbi:MAG: HEAT repeat domain-containing protein [Chloroflexota bacterium]
MHELESLQTYIDRLGDDDPVVRAGAVAALGRLRDPAAVDALVWLMGDESRWVRCNAAEALGEIRDPSVVEPLIAFLRLGTEAESRAAGEPHDIPIRFHTFTRLPDPAYAKWLDEQQVNIAHDGLSLAVSARLALRSVGMLATDELIDLFADENPYTRYIARMLLNDMCLRKKPRESLIAALRSSEQTVRVNAVLALGRIGNFAVVDDLIPLLSDEDPQVVAATVETLGIIGDRRALMPLRELTDTQPILLSTIQTALNALGES